MGATVELCDECGKEPARIHFCQRGKTQSNLLLCQSCWASKAPAEALQLIDELAGATCRYCGGAAKLADDLKRLTSAHGSPFDLPREFLCYSCFSESITISLPALQALAVASVDASHSSQITALHEILARVDRHMHQWVRQKFN